MYCFPYGAVKYLWRRMVDVRKGDMSSSRVGKERKFCSLRSMRLLWGAYSKRCRHKQPSTSGKKINKNRMREDNLIEHASL